ncbi:hypothetical protein M409DRAFT_26292 [Zasmidium cellare ATCC 36951]|uniref:HTH araC/xylS-type domain-containing protein n=1 Tax=Zasmidium cellare ATCC 36951 TaxID=1080233 RepID=A0A6A6CAI6_ZASCE|nr:uncharacterized protein M409DRAFT_26292 [Zasmidium cellare ATCC 36951]KAF2163248.1 hypothetical protein M409DRAFT_26292 [Zasmidium cellare ATCC 36951]
MAYTTEAERWAAVKSRDPNAEGHFVYTVKTTKIFCRPTCNARLARRSNIGFANTGPEAQGLGFRACKRCRPELAKFVPESEQSIEKVRQMLENLPNDAPLPRLETLASAAGLTKYHFHRCFKKATGLTPRDYALQRRQSRMSETSPQAAIPGDSTISTPSLAYDATPQHASSATPDTVKTPDFTFDDWLAAGPEDPALFDNYPFDFGTIDMNSNAAVPQALDLPKNVNDAPISFPIHYSVVDTMDGVLLMAFEEAQVCKLELVATTVDAMMALERSFPKLYYVLVPVEEMLDEQGPVVQQKVRAVVEALEHPFGKATTMQGTGNWQNGMG